MNTRSNPIGRRPGRAAAGSSRVSGLGIGVGLILVAAAYPQSQKPGQNHPSQGTNANLAKAPLQPATAAEATFFETKIRPVLANSCLPCHGKKQSMSGLCIDSAADFRKGGDSGAAFVTGNPDKSLIIQAIRQSGDLKMPPGGKKLSPDQIADFEAWIKMGAPWPEGQIGTTQSPLWSLQPVIKPAVPSFKGYTFKGQGWIRNPIDAFVLRGLKSHHLAPAPAADRRTLLRRVTYDLTGLPPTPEEMDSFLQDKSPGAYDSVVDRLLASPHYGERWARHWLDVARYADTKGYAFNEDRNYPNAYTYRNWVIDAFNKNLPYDQFIIQQLAADRLPGSQTTDKQNLAALGFLTVGRRFLNSQPDIIDDRIDVTMRGFEGLTVACARCHDHKFDPIPSQDYYSLYSVFASSDEVTEPISSPAISDPWNRFNEKQTAIEGGIQQIVVSQVKELREANKNPAEAGKLGIGVKEALQAVPDGQTPQGENLVKLLPGFDATQRQNLFARQQELEALKKTAPPMPEFAMAMKDDPHPHDGYVFKRGKPENPGPAAPRRFLTALTKPGVERQHWVQDSGRLELAEAIASRENPLTARVYVNRVWQDHFGTAIVRTPSDFGHQGERPTDPALLDYLAATFIDQGWNIKKLQRLIVTSATYRQSADATPAAMNADPDNRLWGRMNRRRLDLEEMRDSVLEAAGRLDLKDIGGKSVDLWSEPFTPRRAVYGFVERQNLPGIFRTFDFATPDSTNARRFMTTVPQQALFFMNSPFTIEQAEGFAQRPEIKNSADTAQQVRRLYRLLFQRLPDANELALGKAYLSVGGGPESELGSVVGPWLYGYGGYDPTTQRTSFTPFPTFEGGNYRIGQAFPDPTLGYLFLNAQGGHPGHDGTHAAVRRWTAPSDLTVAIQGTLIHRQNQGDGVRARIVSSRRGLLGEWTAFNRRVKTDLIAIDAKKGETLDFVVDPITNDGFDAFAWAPHLVSGDGKAQWNAAAQFEGPPPPPLTRLELYAQALMMTNEFLFID